MTLKEYYDVLGIPEKSGIDEIKKAYRKKAYLYHPDINHSPEAKDQFITVTEAYEFLIANHNRIEEDEKAYQKVMDDWRRYRQDRSRMRAHAYARASYSQFKKTKFYRTTRIFDFTRTFYSFFVAILVLSYTIYGYIYRLHNPYENERPSLVAFLLLLSIGLIFLAMSLIHLKAWFESSRWRKKDPKK
jgi:DnaJ-class molecular chaperone